MNFKQSIVSFAMLVATLSVLLLLIGPENAEAKRGCSAFGHACFGGHGKRSNENVESGPYYEPALESLNVNDMQPSLQNLAHSLKHNDFLKSPKAIDLSPYVKQWMDSYRRAQLQHQIDYSEI